MNRRPTNLSASVRARLLNIRSETGEDYNQLLTRYALERLLYRLSISPYRDTFVLKGAMLFLVWESGIPHRPTRDIDLLGFGSPTQERLDLIFRELCSIAADDGIQFDSDSVRTAQIRAEQLYVGVRVKVRGLIGNARVPIQVDVGFGDSLTPPPVEAVFPRLLNTMPEVVLRCYRRETAIAEKLEAILKLGLLNTRFKDYYDLDYLSRHYDFEGAALLEAVRETLRRRESLTLAAGNEIPAGLSDAFWRDPSRSEQWDQFRRKGVLATQQGLQETVERVRAFTLPLIFALRSEGSVDDCRWSPEHGQYQ